MTAALTDHERRRRVIAHARDRRTAELAPLRAEVARAVAEVGWTRARPVVEAALGPGIHVSGPRGAWRGRVGKRAGARILAGLAALPAQLALPLSHPAPTVRSSPR